MVSMTDPCHVPACAPGAAACGACGGRYAHTRLLGGHEVLHHAAHQQHACLSWQGLSKEEAHNRRRGVTQTCARSATMLLQKVSPLCFLLSLLQEYDRVFNSTTPAKPSSSKPRVRQRPSPAGKALHDPGAMTDPDPAGTLRRKVAAKKRWVRGLAAAELTGNVWLPTHSSCASLAVTTKDHATTNARHYHLLHHLWCMPSVLCAQSARLPNQR